ncbi:MAG: DUF262 domain-containing protein [Nitrospiria bacterium]
MSSPPKPNTQALSWFFGEYKIRTLRLKPRYQRNPIWSIGQKCFLIDSLIAGCPIPQVFLNIVTEGAGVQRKTFYDVVDGQQRLNAILEYMQDEYALVATTAKSYPVSDGYKPHIGKKYSQLPPHLQDAIWDYALPVQELRGWDDTEIRALFRRLNYVVERLSKQEMRHSQYFGEFVEAVEALANEPFWDTLQFFSRRDSQRMRDIEFVSELFVLLIDGPQDQQKTLDRFYANYDVDFPKKKQFMRRFRTVLRSLQTIVDVIRDTRFSKKADFYALFGAAVQINTAVRTPSDLSAGKRHLRKLDKELRKSPDELTGMPAKYYSTVIEGPNKLAKRKLRVKILHDIFV